MTQRNDRAWQILMEKLSQSERDRLLRLTQELKIDTDDPMWVMMLATSMTRGEIVQARTDVARDIEAAIEHLNKELAKTRKRMLDIADAELRRKHQQYQREIAEAAQQAIRQAVNREKPRRPWRSIAIAGLAALMLTAAAAGLGAVAGRQEAAATHQRLADRFQGPYTQSEEELLTVVDGNLLRARKLMNRCRDNAFEPVNGGRACKVTLWLEQPGGEPLDQASPGWLERTWRGFWTALSLPDDPT
jgi:ElaB/YqjD/DUF883 family membrane-anchored ribosome-binding protein